MTQLADCLLAARLLTLRTQWMKEETQLKIRGDLFRTLYATEQELLCTYPKLDHAAQKMVKAWWPRVLSALEKSTAA